MSLTPSTMVALGTKAPNFTLPEPLNEKARSLADIKGKNATLVIFMCNHCPFVKHILNGLIEFARDHKNKGIGIVAINANDITHYPDDAPAKMAELAQQLPFPYLFDLNQSVAKAYQAACTPDFFLYNANLELVYRGQFDDARPGNEYPVTGYDLRQAVNRLLMNQAISSTQKPSMGCNIKWK